MKPLTRDDIENVRGRVLALIDERDALRTQLAAAQAREEQLRNELGSCDCTTGICPDNDYNPNCTTHRILARPADDRGALREFGLRVALSAGRAPMVAAPRAAEMAAEIVEAVLRGDK
jgi:hypothetical protein